MGPGLRRDGLEGNNGNCVSLGAAPSGRAIGLVFEHYALCCEFTTNSVSFLEAPLIASLGAFGDIGFNEFLVDIGQDVDKIQPGTE